MTTAHCVVDEAGRDGIDKLVVGAVVYDGDRVLLLRRAADDFMGGIEELPSGGVEPGEDLLAALARELTEEIGWSNPVDGGFVSTFDYTSGGGRKARQVTFAVPYRGANVVLSAEHEAHRWVSLAELGGTDVTPETRATITEWASARA